jgi:hypothetical protein
MIAPRDPESSRDDHLGADIGQQMAQKNPPISRAQRTGRQHELRMAKHQHLASDQSSHPSPPNDADHHENHRQGWLDGSCHCDEEQKGRKRQSDIRKPHHQSVYPTSVISGKQTEENSERYRHRLRDEAYREGKPGTVQYPAQDVASLGVGAQEEPGSRLDQIGVSEVPGDRIVRGEPGGKDRRNDYGRDEEDAQLKEVILPQSLPQHTFGHSIPVTEVTRFGGEEGTGLSYPLSPRGAHDSCIFW